jgi:hypothetical protein
VVKPDKGADFEAAWGQIKQLYASVEDPGLKAVGASLKLMKPTSLPPTAGLQYWFFVDPVFKDTSYDFVKIVYYVKPGPDAATPGTPIMKREDQDALWNKLKDCIQGINPIKFTKIGG